MRISLIFSTLVMVFATSCLVPKKKFDDMLAQKVKTEADLADKLAALQRTQDSLMRASNALRKLRQDSTDLTTEIDAAEQRIGGLNKDYDQLNSLYKNLLNNSGKLSREMTTQKDQLLAIQQNLDITRRKNDSLSVSLADREKKVKELENVLSEKDKAVQALKSRISNALLNFKENDLTVKVKNGKVYVSLAEQLLFKSGSIQVDPKGVTALQQLAKAIKDQKDLNITVEGHTDNVPMANKGEYMQDNWDLSVLRATAITKILTKAGLSAGQVTASGKGEFSPLAANTSAETRQKNRRTEIIITPNLDELFKILESN